jgi:CRISPR-associated endonuclease Cas2
MNKKHKKIGSFIVDVLDIFLGIPESLVNAFDRKEFYRIMNGEMTEKILTCDNIAKLIFNLKRSGYIMIEKPLNQNDSESIRFTNKAKLAVVDRIARRIPDDNTYHFVSFDIPERLRSNRDKFRRTIKRLGFVQIQKSLWVCSKDVGILVELAATEYKVDDYIVYIVSESTNINAHIKNKFKQATLNIVDR